MKYIDDYRNPDTAKIICKHINELAQKAALREKTINIMEVCGSHTMAIGRYGIRELLPQNIRLISGPGCPVCVTDPGYIDAAVKIAGKNLDDIKETRTNTDEHGRARTNTDAHGQIPTTTDHRLPATDLRPPAINQQPIIATFGDMINVPGSKTTLSKCRSEGMQIEVCYSPLSTLDLAKKYPDREIIFLAVGFETTIAPVMGLLNVIERHNIENISFLTAFKLIPPALEALASDPELEIDAFLCPAHVSTIIGSKAYEPFVDKHQIPCVIASFEPVEILYGIMGVLRQLSENKSKVENQYKRFVTYGGNLKAQKLMSKYLESYDSSWRGIGTIPNSGLKIKEKYSRFDATIKFSLEIAQGKLNHACKCGDVLKGKMLPSQCPLFAKTCNPEYPMGPCMVSTEGSCAAFYKYNDGHRPQFNS